MGTKEKFPLYLSPEKKATLERRYTEDGSRSLTAFIENAIDFYLDYLSANNAGLFLPTSVQSYLDGRLDQFENQLIDFSKNNQNKKCIKVTCSNTFISCAS